MEVHHVSEKFVNIIKKFTNSRLCDLSYDEFKSVANKVITYHKNVAGITYCIDCHGKIDPRRRLGENKKD